VREIPGGPVGVRTLAAALGEGDGDSLEDLVEPYLMQIGFLDRTLQAAAPRTRLRLPRAQAQRGAAVQLKKAGIGLGVGLGIGFELGIGFGLGPRPRPR